MTMKNYLKMSFVLILLMLSLTNCEKEIITSESLTETEISSNKKSPNLDLDELKQIFKRDFKNDLFQGIPSEPMWEQSKTYSKKKDNIGKYHFTI